MQLMRSSPPFRLRSRVGGGLIIAVVGIVVVVVVGLDDAVIV